MSKFSEVVEKYFNKSLLTDPLWASGLGFQEYDGLLPDGGLKEAEADIELQRQFLQEINQFKDAELNDDEKIDKKVLNYALSLSDFRYSKLQLQRRYPQTTDIIGGEIYSLITRDVSPEKRLESIMRLIKKAPLYLENSKELCDKPVWIWLDMAIDSCRRMKGFIDFIEQFAATVTQDTKTLQELHLDAINIRNSFKAQEMWLYEMQPHADKEFAIGEELYNELLQKRMIPYTAREILEIGENYIELINGRMNDLVAKIDPSMNRKDLVAKIKKGKKLPFKEVLKECKRVMLEARSFVVENEYADIPDGERLVVEETPIFMRHLIPFAAYCPPGKFEVPQKGIYMMTPTEMDENAPTDFSIEDIASTSVHEGYPGHHLQFACGNSNPSLARVYSHATEFVEGWAHYCEDATAEAGFYNTPEAMLIRLSDMLWRAWRIVIDVKLACGEMSFEEAVNHLVEDVGLDYVGALAEVKRYTYTPAYQLSYLIGKHMIKDMKKKFQAVHPEAGFQKMFHNTMLYSGTLPVMIMDQILQQKFATVKV